MSTAFRYFIAASEQGYDLAHGKSRQGQCNGDAVVDYDAVFDDDDHYSDDNDDEDDDDDGSDDHDDDDHDSDEEKKKDHDASYYHHHHQQSIDSSHCFQVGRGSASRKGPGLSRTSPGQSATT